MINFNELPKTNAMSAPPKGDYIAVIEVAEMKQGNDATKPMYLNLRLALSDVDGQSRGKIFDIISESTHEIVKFKLRRLIEACEIPITGNFELKDLVKILPGKTIIVQTTIEEKDGKPAQGKVDVFAPGVFYPISEKNKIFGLGTPTTAPMPTTIDATDADDHPFAPDAPAPAKSEEY